MILNTSTFNKYGKTIDKLTSQGSGIGRSIYLNFTESKAYVMNIQTMALARFSFTYELEEGEEQPEDILLEVLTFKNYYQRTDELTLQVDMASSQVSISFEGVSGKMPVFRDDSGFDTEFFNKEYVELIDIADPIYNEINVSAPWIAVEAEEVSLEALFIHNKTLYNADSKCLYISKLDTLPDETSTRLSRDIVFNIISFGSGCKVSESEEQTRLVSFDEDAEYIEPKLTNYAIPEFPTSEEFEQAHSGDDTVVVTTEDLVDAITFIDPFTAKQKYKIVYVDMEGDRLVVYTENTDTGISKKFVNILDKNVDSIIRSKMNFSLWKKAVKVMKTPYLELTINGNTPFFKVRGFDKGSKGIKHYTDNFLIIAKYGE